MLDQLELLCADLSAWQTSQGNDPIVFGFGTSAELNVLADSVGRSFLLFHEGYFRAMPKITAGGHFQESYSLNLSIFSPSSIQNSPAEKRAIQDRIKPIYKQIFKRLDLMGTISNPSATGDYVRDVTDRQLTGILLVLTLTTDPESLC